MKEIRCPVCHKLLFKIEGRDFKIEAYCTTCDRQINVDTAIQIRIDIPETPRRRTFEPK